MILVISPHLDDAVFSCGGLLAALPSQSITVATCFTRSMPDPRGFALACQRDKGLPDDVDYMELRKLEDRAALELLHVDHRWLDFPEAPHRGYTSAADLFAGIHADDTDIRLPLRKAIGDLLSTLRPDWVLYPFGAGNHADHLQVIDAVTAVMGTSVAARLLQYYDQPYTARHAAGYPELRTAEALQPGRLAGISAGCTRLNLSPVLLEQKIAACAAYGTQVPFQFGDVPGMGALLGDSEYFWRA